MTKQLGLFGCLPILRPPPNKVGRPKKVSEKQPEENDAEPCAVVSEKPLEDVEHVDVGKIIKRKVGRPKKDLPLAGIIEPLSADLMGEPPKKKNKLTELEKEVAMLKAKLSEMNQASSSTDIAHNADKAKLLDDTKHADY